jgi:hypothetical protein
MYKCVYMHNYVQCNLCFSTQSHGQACNLVIVVVCVSEFPPFHLEVWCQVKLTCSSLNSPITVHTCKEKFLYSNVVVL